MTILGIFLCLLAVFFINLTAVFVRQCIDTKKDEELPGFPGIIVILGWLFIIITGIIWAILFVDWNYKVF